MRGRRQSLKLLGALVALLCGVCTHTVFGKWTNQTVQLQPGWNAVFLEVQPTPADCENFFGSSSGQAGQPIYRLGSGGTWARVSPSADQLRQGEAYWVQCAGQSSYPGPLGIVFEQGHGIDYGRVLTEETLTLQNNTTNA